MLNADGLSKQDLENILDQISAEPDSGSSYAKDMSVDEWVSLHFPKDLSTEEALDRLEKHESSLRNYNVTD